jgi:hypothetical protein
MGNFLGGSSSIIFTFRLNMLKKSVFHRINDHYYRQIEF